MGATALPAGAQIADAFPLPHPSLRSAHHRSGKASTLLEDLDRCCLCSEENLGGPFAKFCSLFPS